MTYAEATRQAEEDARWIRNAKLELDKRAERLAKCQAIINAALTVEVVQEPAAVFVHPDDLPEPPALDLTDVVRSDEQAASNGAWQ